MMPTTAALCIVKTNDLYLCTILIWQLLNSQKAMWSARMLIVCSLHCQGHFIYNIIHVAQHNLVIIVYWDDSYWQHHALPCD